MQLPLQFTASSIPGAGRGKEMGIPTINVDLSAVPLELEDGIYACFVHLNETAKQYMGALHYGPRPVFQDSRACEVHILDADIPIAPHVAQISIVEYIREIQNFSTPEELVQQIEDDITKCRSILQSKA